MRNKKMFHIMNIDPNNSKFRKVTEREVVMTFDSGGCTECGHRYHGEPNPLRYADCKFCHDEPCFHHGRCCPKRGRFTQEWLAQEDGEPPESEVAEADVCASGSHEQAGAHIRPSTKPRRTQGVMAD